MKTLKIQFANLFNWRNSMVDYLESLESDQNKPKIANPLLTILGFIMLSLFLAIIVGTILLFKNPNG